MSTVIATTVRFEGRERAVFTCVEGWIDGDPDVPDADRDVVRSAAAGRPLLFGQLVALLDVIDRLVERLEATVEHDGESSVSGYRAARATPAVRETRRIVVALISLDEVMFGNTEYDLCSA
jgi:hypothetical protein